MGTKRKLLTSPTTFIRVTLIGLRFYPCFKGFNISILVLKLGGALKNVQKIFFRGVSESNLFLQKHPYKKLGKVKKLQGYRIKSKKMIVRRNFRDSIGLLPP